MTTIKEECYILLGEIYPDEMAKFDFVAMAIDVQHDGTFAGVDFDYKRVYDLEDQGYKVIGFLHTHPQTDPRLAYSNIDHDTMRAWCSCLGRDLICAIATCDYGAVDAFLFGKEGYQGRCNIFDIVRSGNSFPELICGYLPTDCEHDWVDARNEKIQSGELCTKCFAMRPGNETGQESTEHPQT
jgi:hypothetical protein